MVKFILLDVVLYTFIIVILAAIFYTLWTILTKKGKEDKKDGETNS